MKHHAPTVTNGPWSVSVITGSSIAGAILHVYRFIGGKFIKGDAYGKLFESIDEANAFALERGYSLFFYARVWCYECRKCGINIIERNKPGSFCPKHDWLVSPQSKYRNTFIPDNVLPLPG